MYLYLHIDMYKGIYTYEYMYIPVHMQLKHLPFTHVRICMCTHADENTHTCTHIRVNIHM